MNIANVDLRLLRVFVAVVESKGFSAAQAQLNVGQSTISNHMIALEERLQCRLCERGRGGFELTRAGQVVYDSALRLFEALDDFSRETQSLEKNLAGTLRVGIVDNTVTDPYAPMTEALRRFSKRTNSVEIDLHVDAPEILQRKILERDLDIAIYGIAQPHPNLELEPLYTEASALYCGRSHPLFSVREEDITMEKIREYPFASRPYWRELDLNHIGARSAAATAENIEAQLILVMSGAFLCFLPVHLSTKFERNGSMKPLLVDQTSYTVDFQMVTLRGTTVTPSMATFMKDIRETAAHLSMNQDAKLSTLFSWNRLSKHAKRG